MSRKRKFDEQQEGEVDMTPMLDIVFILLIFFIVTTSFVREEGLLVNKPKANKAQKSDSPIILVRISSTGLITFNGKSVDIERLAARIESFTAKSPTTSAVVIPSYETTHENVVKVIDEIKQFEDIIVSIGK
ncbi:ExbD/TolR family protein [Thalassotalea atypica]|uniref:ExbD/TolR family protein n=1 Tax=Thalassotalea atypica TaxID=2054316 RepID=UPI00257344F2|nr:biopolymer transporter ExbD [Thalassotalea atypica]